MRYAGFKFAASIVLAMSFGCSHVRQLEPAQIQALCPARFGAPGTTGPPIVGLAVIHLFNEPRRSFRMRPVNGEALPSGVVVRSKPVRPRHQGVANVVRRPIGSLAECRPLG